MANWVKISDQPASGVVEKLETRISGIFVEFLCYTTSNMISVVIHVPKEHGGMIADLAYGISDHIEQYVPIYEGVKSISRSVTDDMERQNPVMTSDYVYRGADLLATARRKVEECWGVGDFV